MCSTKNDQAREISQTSPRGDEQEIQQIVQLLQGRLEPLTPQWVWTISKLHRWAHWNSHQHYRVYPMQRCAQRLMQGYHLRAVCVHNLSWEFQEELHMVRRRRQPNQLSRQSDNTHCWHARGQDAVQHLCVYKKSKLMTIDISNFYLMTPLKRPGYVLIKITGISNEIIVECNLCNIVTNKTSQSFTLSLTA